MFTFEHAVRIERPADEVFERLVDVDRYSEWISWHTEALTPGPLGSGSRLAMVSELEGEQLRLVAEMTEVAPARRLAFRTIEPDGIGWDGAYELAADGPAATHLVMRNRVDLTGAFAEWEPVIAAALPGEEAAELERLRQLLEARSPAPAAAG